MMLPRLQISWAQRPLPLAPRAVVALGPAAETLGRRILRPDFNEQFSSLEGVAADNALLLLGSESHLPWVDGAVYLGRDSTARGLLVPTALIPSIPLEVLARALEKNYSAIETPIAVLPKHGLLISAAKARPMVRGRLEQWLPEKP